MNDDAIERRVPAAEVVQRPENRQIESGQEIRHENIPYAARASTTKGDKFVVFCDVNLTDSG
jgi:hypothetical protein